MSQTATQVVPAPNAAMFGPTRDGGGDGVGYGATMTASIGFYLVCSTGMSIFNKLAITALPLPMTLVSIQMLFTVRPRDARLLRSVSS